MTGRDDRDLTRDGDRPVFVIDLRVRDVIARAPALTADQIDQLRDLLPPISDRTPSATDAA